MRSIGSATERPSGVPDTPEWLTAREAALRMRVGVKAIYAEVRAGRLKAARVGGRRALRFRPSWIDDSLAASVEGRSAGEL